MRAVKVFTILSYLGSGSRHYFGTAHAYPSPTPTTNIAPWNETASVTNLTSGSESIPDEFNIGVKYKPSALPIPKDDTMLALLRCVADIAYSPWELALPPVMCRSETYVRLLIRPSKTERMQTKHAIWSLHSVMSWWIHEQRGHFAETNFLTKLDNRIIGFGSVQAQPNSMVATATENITSMVVSNISTPSGSTNLGASPIYLDVSQYDPARSLLISSAFYPLILDAMIIMAEHPMDMILDNEVLHDPVLNVTLEWGATSAAAAAQGVLNVEMAIEALYEIAEMTMHLPARSRFAALSAKIRREDNGAIVGRLNFFHGTDPEWLWTQGVERPEWNDGGGVQVYQRATHRH